MKRTVHRQISRVESTVESKSVKMLRFAPSGRVLWIVVGRDNEYWLDPDQGFCTCKDYYFSSLTKGEPCYHLKSVQKAVVDNKFVLLEFSDDEYTMLLQALAEDSEAKLLQ
jgi:predicted nucleic acid-binding Zn finger protein